jgi:phosphonate transport system substrate-binding protein
MLLQRRSILAAAAALPVAAPAFAPAPAFAEDWRTRYPTLAMGVGTAENEADRVIRYKPVIAYLEKTLGVKIEFRNATDYAGVIEALAADKIQVAQFGPASYAQAWIVSGGKVVPLLGQVDNTGDFGYFSVVVVKADSPYQSIEDLKGTRFAFADPNSTSGFQAPAFFLKEAGYDPAKFFASTAFSGSHENSVIALLNGTFDAAATWWNNDERSNYTRMWDKGMIPRGSVRVIWKSPRLPSSPLTVRADAPVALRQLVRDAFYNMQKDDPAAWQSLTDGKVGGWRDVTHADYEAIVRLVQDNRRARRGA